MLQEATSKNFEGGSGVGSQAISLGSLVETLTRVYEQCGFSSDASVTPLHMLSKIEASRLSSARATVHACNPHSVPQFGLLVTEERTQNLPAQAVCRAPAAAQASA
jgi:hypothetical protein